MAGLVEQIQVDAMDAGVAVSTLLRKVKVAAVKLGLNDALEWVESELGGYKGEGALPSYRSGHGQTIALNPYHGWQPFQFGDSQIADLVSTVSFYEPIGNYEALLESSESSFTLYLSNEMIAKINQTFNLEIARIANTVSRGMIVQIVQRVRDMVLDWALELSRAGVTGEGLSFTADERQKASGAHISIGTFSGSFNAGDVSGANPRIIQGGSDQSSNISADNSVFERVEHAIRTGVGDEAIKEALLTANRDMREASDHATLLAAYSRFISVAANHMTVIGPFLPALGQLLA